jgi:hypothetical protein
MARSWLLVLGVVCAPGCADRAAINPDEVEVSHVLRVTLPLTYRAELDLLFVIDSSPAMAPHRETVLANARNFIASLSTLQRRPDLHIGVITSDVGTRGARETSSSPRDGCSAEGDGGLLRRVATVSGPFVIDRGQPDGSRLRNYVGDLGEVLASLLDAGTAGCPISRPLEAIRRALSSPANAGFRRPHAKLAIIFLTPQDDCSFEHAAFLDDATPTNCALRDGLVPLDEYAELLRSDADPYPSVGVGGAFGPAKNYVVLDGHVVASCAVGVRGHDPSVAPRLDEAERSALPAIRLQALFDRFPNHSVSTTLCQADLSGALPLFSELPDRTFYNPCLPRDPIDVDPDAPGEQHACVARLERRDGDTFTSELLPTCDQAAPGARCWRLAQDDRLCPSNPHLPPPPPFSSYLVELNDPFTSPPAVEVAVVECVTH